MITNTYFKLFIVVCNLLAVYCVNEDEINNLPGLSQPINFKQYSGYIDITNDKHYFYWFVESQKDPANSPVVLWLNGGPGCSSLFGNLGENGPFRVNSDGKTLVLNPSSWNTVANIIYLETPVKTGFSYTDNKTHHNTDTGTAADNYLFLEKFFEKYPNFKKNSFYITGESYAGIHIPLLAKNIYKAKSTINLKGVGIGNGVLTGTLDDQSNFDFALAHGLITTDSYEKLIENCCECKTGQVLHECDFTNPDNKTKCQSVDVEMQSTPNPYNIYDDCDASEGYKQLYNNFYSKLLYNSNVRFVGQPELNKECPHNGYSDYLNNPDVRKALHVHQDAGHWADCSGFYSGDYEPMHDTATELINDYKLEKFLVYNGDFDTVCNFIGDQRFVDGMGFKKVGRYSSWKTPDGSIGGFVEKYEKGLSFVLIRGAGHMVPHDKPEAALQMFKDLIGVSKL